MAKRVNFIRHRGVEILHINWSNATPDEIFQAIDDAKAMIAVQPAGSVRTLTTVDGAQMNRAVTDVLKDYVAHNKPYVIAGAVVGLNDLKMVIFNFVNRITGRALRAMDDVDDAKDWLASVK